METVRYFSLGVSDNLTMQRSPLSPYFCILFSRLSTSLKQNLKIVVLITVVTPFPAAVTPEGATILAVETIGVPAKSVARLVARVLERVILRIMLGKG